MLFEMATGNFSFRLKPTFNNDELDKLMLVLNCIAQEMKDTIVEAGYVNPHFNYQNLVQHLIVVDSQFIIKGFNSESAKQFQNTENCKMNFCDILTPPSQKVWDNLITELQEDADYHRTVQFTFQSASKQVIPLLCTVSRLRFIDVIVISSVTTILQDLLIEVPITKSFSKKSDAAMAQQIYDYILKNLDEPSPTAQQFAILFDTTDYHIKESFRYFFNTSIYRFYIDERIKKSHIIIQKTNIPLKEIAYMSGFNDYATFSKAFKKKFGYSPRDLIRNE